MGAHLLNGRLDSFYWRERNREVDFVVETPQAVTALEVTSGRAKTSRPGLSALTSSHPSRALLVGGQGIGLEEFLSAPPERWFR